MTTTYTVTSTIQSRDTSNPEVEVRWYRGPSLAIAVAAMAQAATDRDNDTHLPESVRFNLLAVHMTITETEG